MKWNSKQSEGGFHIPWQLCHFKPQTEQGIKTPNVKDEAACPRWVALAADTEDAFCTVYPESEGKKNLMSGKV